MGNDALERGDVDDFDVDPVIEHGESAGNRLHEWSTPAAGAGCRAEHAAPRGADVNVELRRHRPWVGRLARQVLARVPASIELDDLIQVGMLGLHEALTRFDPAHGVAFEAYAAPRVRGAMMDELRSADTLSRSERRQQRDAVVAIQLVGHRLGREPTDGEVAQALGLTLQRYHLQRHRAYAAHGVSLGDGAQSDEADAGIDVQSQMHQRHLRDMLADEIGCLPPREQHVLRMHYEDDMTLKAIGAVLGVTESRVCQILTRSVTKLRTQLMADVVRA